MPPRPALYSLPYRVSVFPGRYPIGPVSILWAGFSGFCCQATRRLGVPPLGCGVRASFWHQYLQPNYRVYRVRPALGLGLPHGQAGHAEYVRECMGQRPRNSRTTE